MKSRVVLFIIAFVPFLGTAQTFDLTLNIGNIKTNTGHIQIGIYNDPEMFPKVDKEMKRFYIPVDSSVVRFVIEDLVEGEYSLAIYHDLNSDKICNRNFFGIPTEPYGFSKNIRPKFSAPSFKSTVVNLDRSKEITINVK